MQKESMIKTLTLKKTIFYMIVLMILSISFSFLLKFGVIENLIKFFTDNNIIVAMGISVVRLITGYLLSCIIGFIIGFFMAKKKSIGKYLEGPFLSIQTLPNVCWVPLIGLLLGANEIGLQILIVIGTTFCIALGVYEGIKGTPKIYLNVAKTLGVGEKELYKRVIIPAAIPKLIISLKNGWSFAWRALMSGEVINSTIGLGLLLKKGQTENNLAVVVSIMVLIMVIGILSNKLIFDKIEKKINKEYGMK